MQPVVIKNSDVQIVYGITEFSSPMDTHTWTHRELFLRREDAEKYVAGNRMREITEFHLYGSYEEYERRKTIDVRLKALAKLTDEEKEALGIDIERKG